MEKEAEKSRAEQRKREREGAKIAEIKQERERERERVHKRKVESLMHRGISTLWGWARGAEFCLTALVGGPLSQARRGKDVVCFLI